MDVAGAALATSIAMFISWLVSIAYIRKMFPEIQFTFLPRRFSGNDEGYPGNWSACRT